MSSRKRGNKKKNTRNRKPRNDERPSTALRVRGIRSFAPPRILVDLHFFKAGNLSGAGQVTGQRLFPTNAYDVDPLFASSAMPGFAEWGAMYRSYRTLSSKIKIDFANMCTYPVSIVLGPANYDYIATWTPSNYTTLSSQPTSKTKVLAAAGGQDRATLSCSARTNQFAGVMSNAWDAFVGRTDGSSSPAQSWGFFYGGAIQGSTTISPGITVAIRLTVTLEFFELSTPPA